MTDAERTLGAGAVPSRRTVERFILGAFPCGHFAVDWPGSAIFVLAPAIALTFDLTPAQVGLMITIHSAGASFAFLPAGLLSDSVRHRGALLALTFWWVTIGFLCASLAPSFALLAALLALAGLGASAWHPIATGVMVEQMPGQRAKVLGIHAVGGTLAGVGAPLCAGFMLAWMDWRQIFQFGVLPTVIMGIVFLRRANWIPRRESSNINLLDVRDMARMWLRKSGLRTIGIVVLYNMAMMATLSMLPLYMQSLHGYSNAETGMLFAGIWLLVAAGQPVLGALSDRIGRKAVAATGMFAAGLVIATFASISDSIWLAVAVVAGLGALGGIRAVLLASMVEMSGSRESTTLGFAFSVMDGVGALGAVIGGVLGGIEFRYAFYFSAAAVAVAMLLTLIHTFGLQQEE